MSENELVYFDVVSFFSSVQQAILPLSDALIAAVACRETGHQWAIHRKRDGTLLAETKGMKQAVIEAFASGAMS